MSRGSRLHTISTAFSKFIGQGDSLRAHLVGGAFGAGGLKVANVLLQLGLGIVLARGLGPEGYGAYALALALVGLLSIPVELGIPNLVVREIAKYHVKQNWSRMRGLLRRANQIVLGASIVLILGTGSLVWMFGDLLAGLQLPAIAWALTLVPLVALGNLRGAALQGLRYAVQGQMPELLLRPGLLLLLACGAILVGPLTTPRALALHVVAATIALLFSSLMLHKALPIETHAVKPSYDTTTWIRSLLPLSLLSGMYVINTQIDILALGLLTSREEVGIYRVAMQGATFVAVAHTVVNLVIAPHISRLYNMGDTAQLQRMVTWSARVNLLVAIPVAFAMAAFGGKILPLVFGGAYADGHGALAILCVGQLVNMAMGPVGLLLIMTGNERENAKGTAISLAVNLVLNLLLIPRFGMLGAAVATMTALVTWTIILRHKVSRKLCINSTVLG